MSQPVNKIAQAFQAYQNSVNPAAGSPERVLREAFLKLGNKVAPRLKEAVSGAESIGEAVWTEVRSVARREEDEALARISASISKSGLVESVASNVPKITSAVSQAAEAIGTIVPEVLTKDRNGALSFMAKVIHQMTEMIKSNPVLRMILNMYAPTLTKPTLGVPVTTDKPTVSTPVTAMAA